MPRRGPQQTEPKPFFWISLQDKPGPEKGRLILHDRFVGWSGRMELEIEVLSDYLYVGSGNFDLFPLQGREQARYTFARRNGQLVIPGTGIKGAVRSIVEAISNSCVLQSGRRERAPRSHKSCGGVARGQERQTGLCPACRLFGTTGYRGRVHFSDAVPIGDVQTTTIKIADLWPPKQFKGRKFYQTKAFQPQDMRPQKNYRFLEVVAKGTRFRITLFFENTTTAEMGLLVRALGLALHPEKEGSIVYAFPIKIGGAKPRCLGSVRLHPKRIQTLPASNEDLFQTLLAGGERQGTKAQLLAWLADTTLLDQQAWSEFREKAKPQVDAPCPKEVY